MVVAVLKVDDEGSWALGKIRLVVFRSYLQRPKDVVFEGFGEESLVMELENDEEGEEEEERM